MKLGYISILVILLLSFTTNTIVLAEARYVKVFNLQYPEAYTSIANIDGKIYLSTTDGKVIFTENYTYIQVPNTIAFVFNRGDSDILVVFANATNILLYEYDGYQLKGVGKLNVSMSSKPSDSVLVYPYLNLFYNNKTVVINLEEMTAMIFNGTVSYSSYGIIITNTTNDIIHVYSPSKTYMYTINESLGKSILVGVNSTLSKDFYMRWRLVTIYSNGSIKTCPTVRYYPVKDLYVLNYGEDHIPKQILYQIGGTVIINYLAHILVGEKHIYYGMNSSYIIVSDDGFDKPVIFDKVSLSPYSSVSCSLLNDKVIVYQQAPVVPVPINISIQSTSKYLFNRGFIGAFYTYYTNKDLLLYPVKSINISNNLINITTGNIYLAVYDRPSIDLEILKDICKPQTTCAINLSGYVAPVFRVYSLVNGYYFVSGDLLFSGLVNSNETVYAVGLGQKCQVYSISRINNTVYINMSLQQLSGEEKYCWIIYKVPENYTVEKVLANYTRSLDFIEYNGYLVVDPNTTIIIYLTRTLGGIITDRVILQQIILVLIVVLAIVFIKEMKKR